MRLLVLLVLVSLVVTTPSFAGVVSLQELRTVQLESAPKQVTSTTDGRRLYVLTTDNQLLIYNLGGQLQGKLAVDPAIDRIEPLGPEYLLLQKTAKKQAVVARLEISQQIDTSNAPIRGDEKAPVTIVVFDDFECPYCAKTVPLLKQILAKYPGKVKLAFKNFPLSMHRNSHNAALTALAAQRQGKFWELHDLLYQNYNRLNPKKIDELVVQAGLNLDQIKKDRLDPQIAARLKTDISEGTAIGVRGTPTIYVDGRLLQERSLPGFSRLVEDELARLAVKPVGTE